MLSLDHIANLQLDKYRIEAHRKMPHIRAGKEMTQRLAALANAVIGEILNITPEDYEMQLELAHELGTSYLYAHDKYNISGISAYASKLKDTDVLGKNLILPKSILWKHERLKDHYVIGVFIVPANKLGEGEIRTEQIVDVLDSSEVMVAGWANMNDVRRNKTDTLPWNFRSKLNVVAVPCNTLNPMDKLLPALSANSMSI